LEDAAGMAFTNNCLSKGGEEEGNCLYFVVYGRLKVASKS